MKENYNSYNYLLWIIFFKWHHTNHSLYKLFVLKSKKKKKKKKKKKFPKNVKTIEDELSSIAQVQNLIQKRSELCWNINGAKIPCTLVIGAFTPTNMSPYSKKKKYFDGNKSSGNILMFLKT